MPFRYDHNFFYGSGNAPTGATNTVTANPFVNPGSGTRDGYQLTAGSPCIRSGVNIVSHGRSDFYGDSLDGEPVDLDATERPRPSQR